MLTKEQDEKIKELLRLQSVYEQLPADAANRQRTRTAIDNLILSETYLTKYAKQSHKEMLALYEEDRKPSKATLMKGKDTQAIVDAFDALAKGTDGKYKSGYSQAEKDEKVILGFPDGKAASDFFTKQAKENKAFIAHDASGKVLAYSNGKDGKLYGADNKELPAGSDLFKQKTPGPHVDSFTMPSPPEDAPAPESPKLN